LNNVRQRLDALYGDRASVTLTRNGGWTETRVVLPLVHSGATAPASASAWNGVVAR